MEKTYYLIYLYFGKNENYYTVYQYQKSRRFTARQAWHYIYHEQKTIYSVGKVPWGDSIYYSCKIIENLHLEKKLCDCYYTFGFIE